MPHAPNEQDAEILAFIAFNHCARLGQDFEGVFKHGDLIRLHANVDQTFLRKSAIGYIFHWCGS